MRIRIDTYMHGWLLQGAWAELLATQVILPSEPEAWGEGRGVRTMGTESLPKTHKAFLFWKAEASPKYKAPELKPSLLQRQKMLIDDFSLQTLCL